VTAFYRRSTVVFGLIAIGLGFALIIETAAQGGGTVGFVLGALFLGLGLGRLYLARRR
jgi:fucose permease